MDQNVQPSAQAPSLGVQDLLLMFQVLQVTAQRGAFRADEMTNVGGLYDRLKAFLTNAGALQSAEQPANDQSPEKSEE